MDPPCDRETRTLTADRVRRAVLWAHCLNLQAVSFPFTPGPSMAPPAVRGEALGMYIPVSAVARGRGSLLGGAVADISYLLAFVVAGGSLLLGAMLVY